MTESVRRWKEVTTGRKEIPVSEQKPTKKKRDDKGRYVKK
tara:strand:- start:165 stop:284 length:120 start_codon:yes stop_codon:yes gene_type:complete